jgi:hypothetical protein
MEVFKVAVHLYLSMIPEALIASMLSPEEFGLYYAVGTQMKLKGQAVFFELDPGFRHPHFLIEQGYSKCISHEDGTPKASVYIATYRVLEHLDPGVVQKLYLTTDYGAVLGLDAEEETPPGEPGLFLYQEIAPVTRLVASNLSPAHFYESISVHPTKLIQFPAMFFVNLELGELASDPEHGAVRDLPYDHIDHLRECLLQLGPGKHSKIVDRLSTVEFPYRMVKDGFFLGVGKELMYYALPSHEDLRTKYYRWWRSANR